jgi:hypothetical protein
MSCQAPLSIRVPTLTKLKLGPTADDKLVKVTLDLLATLERHARLVGGPGRHGCFMSASP